MFSPKKILVPTDFSKESDNALKAAVEIAGKFQSEVYLLNVIDDITGCVASIMQTDAPKLQGNLETKLIQTAAGFLGDCACGDDRTLEPDHARKGIVDRLCADDFDAVRVALIGGCDRCACGVHPVEPGVLDRGCLRGTCGGKIARGGKSRGVCRILQITLADGHHSDIDHDCCDAAQQRDGKRDQYDGLTALALKPLFD